VSKKTTEKVKAEKIAKKGDKNKRNKKVAKIIKKDNSVQRDKYDVIQQIGILYQVVLSVVSMIVIIFFLIEAALKDLALVILVMLLLCMAFNNHVLFKRKYFTMLYMGCAVLLVLMIFQEIIL